MAQDENILTRLGKLFQSNIIVRKTDDGQLKVKDVDFSQQTSLVNNFVDRYNRKTKLKRGISSLRNLGIKATWKKFATHFYSKLVRYTSV